MKRRNRSFLKTGITMTGLAFLASVAYLLTALAGIDLWVIGYLGAVFAATAFGAFLRALLLRRTAARRRH